MTDQLRQALVVYADSLIEFYDQTDMEKKHFRTLVEAARAWLEFPTDAQVEAAGGIEVQNPEDGGGVALGHLIGEDRVRAALEAARNTEKDEG